MWISYSSAPQYYKATVAKEERILFCVLNFKMQNWVWYEYSWAQASKQAKKKDLGVS